MEGYFSPQDPQQIFILKTYKRPREKLVCLVCTRRDGFVGAKDQKFFLGYAIELLDVIRLRCGQLEMDVGFDSLLSGYGSRDSR